MVSHLRLIVDVVFPALSFDIVFVCTAVVRHITSVDRSIESVSDAARKKRRENNEKKKKPCSR